MTPAGGADAAARFAVGAGHRIPKERYTSAAFAVLEHERLWSRVWQVACRSEEVSGAGDHVEYVIGDERVLVVRGEDGVLRAFQNACLHRGTCLASGFGTFTGGRIRCPYHAWEYELDGRLVAVPDHAQFPDLPPLPADLSLTPVRCDEWGGFVFVNLDAGAEPLLDFLAPIPEHLGPYRLDRMRLRAALTTELPANWKAAVDAFNEAYHVQGAHAQILPWTDDVSIAYEPLGRHARYGRLAGARRALRPSPRLPAEAQEQADEGEILAALVAGLGGAFLAEERALVEEVRAAGLPPGALLPEYQRRRRALLEARGVDTSGLTDDQMTSAEDFYWFPNLVGPIYPGSAILFRVRPAAGDPNRCVKDTWVLEWPSADRPARPPRRTFVADWRSHDWGEITTQDYENLERVQRGMRTSGFRWLHLNPVQEANLLHMHRTIDAYLAPTSPGLEGSVPTV